MTVSLLSYGYAFCIKGIISQFPLQFSLEEEHEAHKSFESLYIKIRNPSYFLRIPMVHFFHVWSTECLMLCQQQWKTLIHSTHSKWYLSYVTVPVYHGSVTTCQTCNIDHFCSAFPFLCWVCILFSKEYSWSCQPSVIKMWEKLY